MISDEQVFFSVNEKAVRQEKGLPHEELEGKNTNPNSDEKQKKKKKLNIEKLETVAHQKMLNNCLL